MEVNEAGPDSFIYTVVEQEALFYADYDLIAFTKPVMLQ